MVRVGRLKREVPMRARMLCASQRHEADFDAPDVSGFVAKGTGGTRCVTFWRECFPALSASVAC